MAEEKQKAGEESSEAQTAEKNEKKEEKQDAEMKKEHHEKQKKSGDKSAQKNTQNTTWLWVIIVILVIGIIALFVAYNNSKVSAEEKPVGDKESEEISKKALDLINGQLVAPGTEVKIGTITEESGLYKIPLTVLGQEVTSYMTKDFTKFIPQLIEMTEESEENTDQQKPQSAEVQTKADQPEVELFVMSYCPYGTQMEKGILPVLKTLGDSVDMELKFVDYAMHGEKELKENLNQYCIQENEPQKLAPYLECFLASTGSEEDSQK